MGFEYIIDSTLDLEEVLDSIHKQLNLQEGTLIYYEGPSHEEINKKLSFEELKKQTLETYNDEKWPSLEFEDVEISMDEDSITIISERELDLEEFDLIKK